jgi:hypothetical protein
MKVRMVSVSGEHIMATSVPPLLDVWHHAREKKISHGGGGGVISILKHPKYQ